MFKRGKTRSKRLHLESEQGFKPNVLARTSRFPGEVVLFETVSKLLGLSEKVQVTGRCSPSLSLMFTLNRRGNRWFDPTPGCVVLST